MLPSKTVPMSTLQPLGNNGEESDGAAAEVSVKGKGIRLPASEIKGRTVVVEGGWLKIAAIKDEDYLKGDVLASLDEFIASLHSNQVLAADIFTFSQQPTDLTPRVPFLYERESVAAIQIASFADWWSNHVSSDLRKDVRKAAKLGVVVRSVPFTDHLVKGIVDIYDETPVRQGRPFWHYKKGFDAVKIANATYLERSEFLGAFWNTELVGFLKIVYVDRVARLMQIIAKDAHRDKRPTNALIAKAVEVCEAKGCSLLTYGKFRYDGIDSSLTAFKHRNGFEELLVPRYYVPLTAIGRMALLLKVHHGAKALIPGPVRQSLRRVRASIYSHSLFQRKVA